MGWEQPVFAGATGVLSQKVKPTIFFESIDEHASRFGFSIDAVNGMFTGAGYSLETLVEQSRKALAGYQSSWGKGLS